MMTNNPAALAAPAGPIAASRSAALAQAKAHVQELRGYYNALLIYAVVNTGLWLVNLISTQGKGPFWAQYATIGWGVGMAIWGVKIAARDTGWLFGRHWEERKVAELMARENLKAASSEKQLVLAQMRMLQAQIEPHFLFNTLANIQTLIGRQPERANLMMDNFIAYLRSSLSASRANEGTLGQEAALLTNYLDLLKIRMGDRLSFAIDLPADLATLALSPMLLQPLVENAVRHGLEPKIEGGHVSVRAVRLGQQVLIEVQDNGLGFSDQAATGVGLANLRERLAVLYDGLASLAVTHAEPGTLVTITLPYSQPTST